MEMRDYINIGFGFFFGIVASLIASFFWYKILIIFQIRRNKKLLSHLEGKYNHYRINGEQVKENYSVISFEAPNILSIETFSSKRFNWRGKVSMDEQIPSSGTGFFEYDYPNKEYWGIINIQVKANSKDILVQSVHREISEGRRVGYIMRKVK